MLLKKVFVVSIVFLVFASIFSGIYFLVFKEENNNEIVKNNSSFSVDNDIVSETVNSKLTAVTSIPILSASINKNDDLIYFYSSKDGLLRTLSKQGLNEKKITQEKALDLKSVDWSVDSDFSILTFNDGNIFINNNETGERINFEKKADFAGWTNIDKKIIYKYFNPVTKERSFNISDIDGSNSKKIAELDFRYVSFQSIPHSIQVAFWPKADSLIETKLFKTNIINLSNSQEIFSGKFGADYLFSSDGNKFLVSYVSEKGGNKINVGIANSDGKEYGDLNIPTLINKIVWSKDNKTIYYAQPSGNFVGKIMPNDYVEKNFFTQDTFWKMDIETGKKERLIELEELTEKIDATNLFLSNTEDSLFFINRINGFLYKLSLD